MLANNDHLHLFSSRSPLLKGSASVQLTPLLVTYVPARRSHSMKEAIRGAASLLIPGTLRTQQAHYGGFQFSSPLKIPAQSPEISPSKGLDHSRSAPQTLRCCPLFQSHTIVICNSSAHTHVQRSTAVSFTLPSAPSESSTLVPMSSSLRFLPRATSRFNSLPIRSGACRAPIPTFRTFSVASTLCSASPQLPAPPAVEKENLKRGEPATFLGTTKRLPEFNLVGRVVCVSGAGRGLGLVQAEALLEAGATGMYFIIWWASAVRMLILNAVYALDRLGMSTYWNR